MASGNSIRKSSNVADLRDKPTCQIFQKGGARKIQKNHSQNSNRPPIGLQQSLLNIIKEGFMERFDERLASAVQTVKGHLFDREFSKAFGSDDLLEAYTIRWSPSRALAYMDLICGLPQLFGLFNDASCYASTTHRLEVLSLDGLSRECGNHADTDTVAPPVTSIEEDTLSKDRIVTCLGGGAGAEILALAGSLHYLETVSSGAASPPEQSEPTRIGSTVLTIRVIDMANWTSVIDKLHQGVTTNFSVSKYCSQTRTRNEPVINSDHFKVDFEQRDILNLEIEALANALQGSRLITLTFTLNELYSTSMSKTTNFLLTLTYLTEPGTLLLVVDSPGSYSIVKLSTASNYSAERVEKKYPMKWMLDHTLLEASSIGNSKNTSQDLQWEKLASSDSAWFRLSDNLKYPLDLEDMRYQYHLYKRI